MEIFFRRYFTKKGFRFIMQNWKLILLVITTIFAVHTIKDKISVTKPSIVTVQSLEKEEPATCSIPDIGFEVHYIDVGQGDATLIICDSKCMLIDAGDNDYGQTVVNYLKSSGVSKIDVVVGTHPDADHIGGLDDVINNFKIGDIYLSWKQSDSESFNDLTKSIKKKHKDYYVPRIDETFSLGRAKVEFIGPVNGYEDNNNNSIITLVTFNDRKFLFMGDAETEGEEDLIKNWPDLKADVLKCGHHGSKTSTTYDFLNSLTPSYAVISCGMHNKYGHPHKETLTKLREMDVKLYRTDLQGTIIFKVKNGKITTEQRPDTTWVDGNGNEAMCYTGEYVVNTNTYKFHLPNCESVIKMTNKNKEFTDKTKRELLNEGYSPCNSCKP